MPDYCCNREGLIRYDGDYFPEYWPEWLEEGVADLTKGAKPYSWLEKNLDVSLLGKLCRPKVNFRFWKTEDKEVEPARLQFLAWFVAEFEYFPANYLPPELPGYADFGKYLKAFGLEEDGDGRALCDKFIKVFTLKWHAARLDSVKALLEGWSTLSDEDRTTFCQRYDESIRKMPLLWNEDSEKELREACGDDILNAFYSHLESKPSD